MSSLQALLGNISLIAIGTKLFVIVLGITGIGFIIGFHELGHFLLCKLMKVDVPTFTIGMGPRLLSRRFGNTQFSLSLLPIGGYVEIKPESFSKKPYWKKLSVMLAGIIFNLVFAYTVFIALTLVGMPREVVPLSERYKPVVATILQGTPACRSALREGDRIITFNDTKTEGNIETLMKLIITGTNQSILLTVERAGHSTKVPVTLGARTVGTHTVGNLGITFQEIPPPRYSFATAIKKGITYTNLLIYRTLMGLKSLVFKRDTTGLGGPVMIMQQTVKFAGKGIKLFLTFLAALSIGLAMLNLIPLPIFDGGQVLLHSIEAIIRRDLPIKIKEIIFGISWIFLLLLTAYIAVRDVKSIYNDRNKEKAVIQVPLPSKKKEL